MSLFKNLHKIWVSGFGHPTHDLEFANAAARTGHTYTSDDIGKDYRQLDTGVFYKLISVSGGVGTFTQLGSQDLSSYATKTGAETLTNKRINSRVLSTTSSATPSINTDNCDIYQLTAQAVDITSFTTNLTGTPENGQKLIIQITGTASRAITWGSSFESSTVTLPTTTVGTDMLSVGFIYNSVTSKWRCMAVA